MTTLVWRPCADGEPLYKAYCDLADRDRPDTFEAYVALVEAIDAAWKAWLDHKRACAGCRVEAVE